MRFPGYKVFDPTFCWQHSERGFKGKPPRRQREVAAGENRPDLSRRIYSACRRVVEMDFAKLHQTQASDIRPLRHFSSQTRTGSRL